MAFDPRRGRHAPGHIRQAFDDWVENGMLDHDVRAEVFDDGPKPLRWLLGQLHNCTDILPGKIVSALVSGGEVRLGMRRSYGDAAHQLRNWRAPDDPRGSARVP
jgi:hypothetical protein